MLCQHCHGGEIAYSIGHWVPLLGSGRPVKRQTSVRSVPSLSCCLFIKHTTLCCLWGTVLGRGAPTRTCVVV